MKLSEWIVEYADDNNMKLSEWIKNYAEENDITLPEDIPDEKTALIFLDLNTESGDGGDAIGELYE